MSVCACVRICACDEEKRKETKRKQILIHTDKHTGRQTHRQTDGQIDTNHSLI